MVESDDDRTGSSLPVDVEAALRALVPARASVVVAPIDHRWNHDLTATEYEAVATAGPVRRAEFASGRHCAHAALRLDGIPTPSIDRGVRGQPVWPDGWTGSISHGAGLAAAVVCRRFDGFRSVGIDLERLGSLDESLWSTVMTPPEQAFCRRSVDPSIAGLLVFSGKEASFKAQFPLSGADLDFLDVEFDRVPGGTDATTIRVLHHVPDIGFIDRESICRLDGRVVGDIVVTVAVIE